MEEAPQSLKNDVYEKIVADTKEKFFEAMDNDFNTPFALSSLFDLVRDVNRGINDEKISKAVLKSVKNFLAEAGEILGFDFSRKASKPHEDITDGLIDILVDVRQKLREKKDWELSDEIRSRLNDLNIVLEDK